MLRRRMLIMLGVVLLIVLVLGGYQAFSIYTMIQGFPSRNRPSASRWPLRAAVADASAHGRHTESAARRRAEPGSRRHRHRTQIRIRAEGQGRAAAVATRQRGRNRPAGSRRSRPRSGATGLRPRRSQLVDSRAISKGEYDRLSAVLQKNKATVSQLNASLAKKRILAPFSGTSAFVRSTSATTSPAAPKSPPCRTCHY